MAGLEKLDSSSMQVQALALDVDGLVRCCSEGDETLVGLLIDKGAEINRASKAGTFPIHEAIRSGNIKCLELLLRHNADIDVLDETNHSTLHYATRFGHVDMLEALVRVAGSRFDASEKDEKQRFLQKFINSKADHDITPLHEAAKGDHVACLDVLIQFGADIDSPDEHGRTPLHYAAEHGNYDAIEVFIEEGATLDATDDDGKTPLHFCCIYGHLRCVEQLVKDSDTTVQDLDGLTALHFACLNNHTQIVEFLLQGSDDWAGLDEASMDTPDEEGRTPTHAAASAGSLACCQLLIQQSAAIKKLDNENRSAICWLLNQPVPPQGDALILNCLRMLWEWWEANQKEGDPPVDQLDVYKRGPLHYACYHGLHRCVKFLLNKKLDCNQPDSLGRTPVHYATSSINCLQTLQSFGGNIRLKDNLNLLPVHLAGYFCCEETLEELTKQDASFLTALDAEGKNILHFIAIRTDRVKPSSISQCVKFCMNKKRELLDTRDSDGHTPIHLATLSGNVVFLQAVIQSITKLELVYYFRLKDSKGRSLPHLAAIQGKHPELLTCFADAGVDLNVLDDQGLTSLHWAVGLKRTAFVQALLPLPGLNAHIGDTLGRPPSFYAAWLGDQDVMDLFLLQQIDMENTLDRDGNTILHFATLAEQYNVVCDLLEEAPEGLLEQQNNTGTTPVHIAAAKGDVRLLRALLEYECDVNIKDEKGRTALHYACTSDGDGAGCVAALLDKGARSDLLDNRRNSALFYAAFSGNFSCVDALKRHKTKLNITNSGGRTALHAAAWKGHVGICNELISSSPDLVNKVCNNGQTALHRAAARGFTSIVQLLLSARASVQASDSNGSTPLMLACYYQHVEVVKCLLANNASPSITDEYDHAAEYYARKNPAAGESVTQEILNLLKGAK